MPAIVAPLPQFFDTDGKPLQGGAVYIGAANLNPETNPLPVFWDAAFTQPAQQPLRTANGVIVRSGTAAQVYVSGDYSTMVKNSAGVQVFYARNSADYSIGQQLVSFEAEIASSASGQGAALVGFPDAVAPAFLKTTSDILNGVPVSVLRFIDKTQWAGIAAGTSTADVSSAFQTAANATRRLEINAGTYRLNGKVTVPQDRQWRGFAKQNTILEFIGAAGLEAVATPGGVYDLVLSDFYVKGDNSGTGRHGIHLDGTASNYGRVTLEDLIVSNFSGDGIRKTRPIVSTLRNIQSSSNGAHGFHYIGDGTSVTSICLYASLNGGDGHRVTNNLQYSTWISCASDANAGHQYNFEGTVALPAEGICLIGCGAESSATGDYFRFVATQGLTINGAFVFPAMPATGGHFINLDGVRSAFLSGIRMARTPAAGKVALKLDSIGGTQFPARIRSAGCEFSSVDAGTFRAYVDLNAAYNPLTLKSGVTGSISNGATVTHDLGVTPNDVIVNTDDATLVVTADSFTDTTFRLLVRDNAGGFPAARAYRWTVIA